MPKWSAVTFNVQRAEKGGELVGYVVSGFVSGEQLKEFRKLVDSDEYQRSKKWRGQFQEFAKAFVGAIDDAAP